MLTRVIAILSRLGRFYNFLAVVLAVLLPIVVTVAAWRATLRDDHGRLAAVPAYRAEGYAYH